jgi:DNA-binding transcriptional LysR family regulator
MNAFIAAGVGFGLMPVHSIAADSDLVTIPTQPQIKRQIALLTRRGRVLPQRVQDFHQYLVDNWPSM